MKELGGKRMAVLVGCNYRNTEDELQGCINDVLAMKTLLIERFGFEEKDIELLTDDEGSSVLPTGANIKKALANMVDHAKEGDVLYFHYSGHGTLIHSLKPHEPDRKDEAIVPCDFNLITDMDFRQLVNKLPPKSSFTIISDSCHSGGLIDQEKEQIGPKTIASKGSAHSSRPRSIPYDKILQKLKQLTNMDIDTFNIATHMKEHFKDQASLSFSLNEHDQDQLGVERATKGDYGILLSGCQSNESCADVQEGGTPHGAFSDAVHKIVMQNKGEKLSNKEVVIMARKLLQEGKFFDQHPCLYCSDDNAGASFLLQPVEE